jgi:hypothetical protein
MVGLVIEEGDARRPRVSDKDEGPADPDLLKAIRERRNLVALAAQPDDHGHALGRLAALLRRPHEETNADPTAAAACAVASHYARRGQWLLADQGYSLLVERYPAQRLSAEAYRWLIRHGASSEARHRKDLKQFALVTNFTSVVESSGASTNPIQLTSGTRDKAAPAPDEPRQRCLDLGKRLASYGPLYGADPALQFCMQASRRQSGQGGDAQEWYARFAKFGQGPWAEAARGEVWLGNGGTAPRRVARCRLTEQRPHLDGLCDDACWQGQVPLRLADAVGATSTECATEAMFAYDQEFLYLALRCQHPAGQQVAPVKARQRDADLDPYDRVALLLDLDRDYATFYRLEVDQRGCVREDCCGDPSWNPRWFVAVKSSPDSWQIEAAIPLAELTSARLPLGSAWAFNLVRILPGRGVQGWSLPADVRPRPEGMSLLHFQQDAGAKARPMPPE